MFPPAAWLASSDTVCTDSQGAAILVPARLLCVWQPKYIDSLAEESYCLILVDTQEQGGLGGKFDPLWAPTQREMVYS